MIRWRIMLQLKRGFALLSQIVNWGLLWGNHDMTVSARCLVEERINNSRAWGKLRAIIDDAFLICFGQSNHCLESLRDDKNNSEYINEIWGRIND